MQEDLQPFFFSLLVSLAHLFIPILRRPPCLRPAKWPPQRFVVCLIDLVILPLVLIPNRTEEGTRALYSIDLRPIYSEKTREE